MRSVTAGWAGASHQIDQRSRSADNGDDFTLLRSPHFFGDFYVKASSGQSLLHILSISSSKSAPAAGFFLHFEMQSDLLPQSREKKCRPRIFQKCSERAFFHNLEWKSSSRWQSCALFDDNFPRSKRETAETETLLRRLQEPHYPTKHRVSRLRVFSPVYWHVMTWCWHEDYLMMTRLPLDIRP